jgi:DNA (cytosine-5)-methyltransferase 1
MIAGFEKAGIPTLAAAELNEAWTASPKLNRPDLPYVTDLSDWEAWAEEQRERDPVLVHGIPPCQGVTGASRASAADNPKNDWILHATRAAMVIQPEFVIFENIPRMLSVGRPIVNMMDDIARANGYTISIHQHDAQHFGVSQRRKRVMFVMERKGKEVTWPTHPRQKAPTVWEAISDLGEIEPRDDVIVEDEDGVKARHWAKFEYEGPPENEHQERLRNPEGFTWNHDLSKVDERFLSIPQGHQWTDMPEEEMTDKELARKQEGRLFNAMELVRLHPDAVGRTITGGRNKIHPYYARLLSQREASRLMGYPDDWRWAKHKDWQQFAAGVCPPVAQWYGECIQHFVAGTPLEAAEGRLFA